MAIVRGQLYDWSRSSNYLDRTRKLSDVEQRSSHYLEELWNILGYATNEVMIGIFYKINNVLIGRFLKKLISFGINMYKEKGL